jgi:hypothetical protein
MVSFSVTAGQVVDFDIDTLVNGPGGLGSYLRLFDSSGTPLATNDDGAAPGENTVGFDAYLRYTFTSAGTFYVGVSNYNNTSYDPITGNGDTAGGANSAGNYELILRALPVDNDDSIVEANSLGAISENPITFDSTIDPDIDVDMFRLTVTAGQVIDFDIDTTQNGPGGLGSYIRLFDTQGTQLEFNNDGAAPGESGVGYDAYLRYTFTTAGTYYLGVSNFNNTTYDPNTGNSDVAGGKDSIGNYRLIVQEFVGVANDPDDAISEANPLGAISTGAVSANKSISPDIDVDMYSFSVTAGQVVDFDIDTTLNGPGAVGSYIRLFNAQGVQLAFNDNGAAPGESAVGFDAYLRYKFLTAGTYYLGVSNSNNTAYGPLTGDGDTAGGANAVGAYLLILQEIPVGTPTLSVAINPGKIPELGGIGIGTVTRLNGDPNESITVNLSSSSPSDATVPSSVTIPANVVSVEFQVIGVHNTAVGTTVVTVTATSPSYIGANTTVTVTDRDQKWHNAANPKDVDNDNSISPLDILAIINYLNVFGSGDVPVGTAPPYLDVDGDNLITPLDVLVVLNFINQNGGGGEGEGEGTFQSPSNPLEPNSVDSVYALYAQGAWQDWETNWKRSRTSR